LALAFSFYSATLIIMNGDKLHRWAHSLYYIAFTANLLLTIYAHSGTFVAWISTKILLLVYILLWIFATATAIKATRILYSKDTNQPLKFLLLYVALSVATCIAGFSIAYLDLSQSNPSAFNVPLTPISALYFSIITFATVGYGDIFPAIDLTRLLVSLEIIIAMLYTILIFSVIAGFVRQKNEDH
jgi:hypothetical protein